MNLKDQLQNCATYTATLVVFIKPKTYADSNQDLRYKKYLTDDDCKSFGHNISRLLSNGWIADPNVEYNIRLENKYGDHLCCLKVQNGEAKVAVDCATPVALFELIKTFNQELKQKFAPSAPPAEYFEPPRMGM